MNQTAIGSKFNICLVTTSLAGGGAERSCAMLSQMLDRLGHEVHIAVLNDWIDYDYSGTLFNMGALKSDKDTLWRRIVRFKKLRKYLLEKKIDFVIDHRPKNRYYRELYYNNYIYKGVQQIYVTHSSKKKEYLTEKPKKFAKLLNNHFASVGVSNYITKEVLAQAGVSKASTIYNAFDPGWATVEEPLPEILSGKRYILSYGRIDDTIKDFTFLIEAFHASGVWEHDFYLVIMGDGPDRGLITELATKRSIPNVIFHNFDPNPFSIIKHARAVALTSRYEGFPMVLVESLSVGTPVVSLDIISGPNEIITHEKNGLLIGKRDLPLLAENLKRICTDEHLYETCKSNAVSSIAGFSMEQIAEQWNNILQHGNSQS